MHNTVALVTAGSAFEPSTARSASTSAAESKSTKLRLDSYSRRRPVVIATSRRNDRLSASVRRAHARARPRSTSTRTHPPGDEYEGLLKHSPLFSHERLEKTSPLLPCCATRHRYQVRATASRVPLTHHWIPETDSVYNWQVTQFAKIFCSASTYFLKPRGRFPLVARLETS